MMEPFAVALHAVKRAGCVAGKRVLVTGGGPIGLLVIITARAFGATPVTLSDVVAGRRGVRAQIRCGCGSGSHLEKYSGPGARADGRRFRRDF